MVNGQLRRVPAAVVRSAAARSGAWRASAKAYAGGLKRAFGQVLGGGLLAAGAGVGASRVTKKRMPVVSGYFDSRGRKRSRPVYGYAPGTAQAAAAHGSSYARKASRYAYSATKGSTRVKTRLRGKKASLALQTRLATPTVVERMAFLKREAHNLEPDTNLGGAVTFGFTDVAGNDTYPLVLMSLTSVNNLNFGYVNNYLLQNDSGGNTVWVNNPQSTAFDGTAIPGGRFTVERQITGTSVTGVTQPYKATHCAFPWFDIRLQLYGCKKQAVTWDVSLISFKQDFMCPEGDSTSSTDQNVSRDAVWQALARTGTLTSILPSNVPLKNYINFIRTKRVKIEATLNDNNAITAQCVDVKWFLRDGKVRRYDRNESNKYGANLGVSAGVISWTRKLLGTTVENFPYPRQRLYLMVRATDYTPSAVGGDAAEFDSPSFSYCIRRKLMAMGNGGAET